MSGSWFIDEHAHAGAEHLDDAFVAAYDRKQQFDPSPDVELVLSHGLGSRSTLVDLGAGTGTFALEAAGRLGRVVAVDISSAMLHVLGRRAEERGIANVECVPAGLLAYEHVGAAPDAVYTRNVLHHLPDFWKGVALARIARMLPGGGLLLVRDLVYDFDPTDADAVLERWFAGAVDDPERGYTRRDLVEHVRTESSTYRWLFEPMLSLAGFDIVDTDYRRNVYASYTCRKR
jgi:ubiquinone/menaquinone biosynthesis C-methylase UbiE